MKRVGLLLAMLAGGLLSGYTPLETVSQRVLKMYAPTSDAHNGASPWVVITPDQSSVPGINATCSSGFNEAEAYAFTKGWSLELYSTGEYQGEGASPLRDYITTNCPGGFVLKPIANRYIKLSAQMLCVGPANAGCVNIDSMMKGKIICDGCEVGSQPTTANSSTTCAYSIKPVTAIPNEGVVGITDSDIDLGNMTTQGGGGPSLAAVCMNIATGGINLSHIHANEINSGGSGATPTANYDLIVQGANGSFSFSGNVLRFNHVHLAKVAAIQIGSTTVNASSYNGNLWEIGGVFPGFAGSDAVNTYGFNDHYRIGSISNAETGAGNYRTPFFAHTGANGNTVEIGVQSGASNGNNCAAFIDQTNSSANPAYQNNYTLNGQICSLLHPTGQINELAPTSFTSGVGAVCQSGFLCTNHRGTIDIGSGNPTTVTITFSMTYLNPPKCALTANANPLTFYRNAYTTGGGGYLAVQYATVGASAMAQHTQVDYDCQ